VPGALPATRDALLDVFTAALAAVSPDRLTPAALDRSPPPDRPTHIIALGKAAPGMAHAAAAWLAERGLEIAGGVVVHAGGPKPDPRSAATVRGHPRLWSLAGDHPVPGRRSLAAAEAIGQAVARVGPGEPVFVLVSGGTSSLAGAPADGEDPASLAPFFERLLASGADVRELNAERRRVLRWGGGRLAAALAGARVTCVILSDVPGGHPEDVGSGPCAGDRPGVTTVLAGSNDDAIRAAVARARALGWDAAPACEVLRGDAAAAGRRLAARLTALADASSERVRCLIWGGETTVRLGADAGQGGRSQELALAAARVFAPPGSGVRCALLAAGTDGRDGPTDAAGAVVDGQTWEAIAAAGLEPAAHLARHDAYPALAAAGALLRMGPTGTNVADLAIGLALPA
jgi:hydroxypyruvate reductase